MNRRAASPSRARVALGSLLILAAFAAMGAVGGEGDRPGSSAAATVDPARPIRVLYCTHSAGYRHEVLPETRALMARLGAELPWLETTVTDECADITPEALARIDVLMLYTSGTLPMSAEQKAALQAFVARGGGIVGVHSASDTFHDWDWFVKTIGGTFDGHPWHEEVGVVVKDTGHESTRHLGERFRILDEIYQFKRLNDQRHTLLELDTASVTHSVESGRAYPLAWTLVFGEGRVFYTALGHRPSVWQDQRFVEHVLGGIRWAGRKG